MFKARWPYLPTRGGTRRVSTRFNSQIIAAPRVTTVVWIVPYGRLTALAISHISNDITMIGYVTSRRSCLRSCSHDAGCMFAFLYYILSRDRQIHGWGCSDFGGCEEYISTSYHLKTYWKFSSIERLDAIPQTIEQIRSIFWPWNNSKHARILAHRWCG